jgi:ribosomal protein S18 acetylase RimI-like enzyme
MTERKVISSNDLYNTLKRIRDFKEGFITNYFLNPSVASIWIKHKLLKNISINKTDFLLRSDNGFAHLYFCSTSEISLISDLSEFMTNNKDRIFTADILGNESWTKEIADHFLKVGFFNYTSLIRMTRNQQKSTRASFVLEGNIEKAQDSDLMKISNLLNKYFDRYSDQLPHVDELKGWIDKGCILLYKRENNIQGFIIFEDIGFTSYLRYWFVHPDYREKRIGSKLINSFFYETQNATRHLFWVNSTNENAIKRYLHFGFLPGDLVDLILINKQIKYEKENN